MINLKNIHLTDGLILVQQQEAFNVLKHQNTSNIKLNDVGKNELRIQQQIRHGIILAMAKDVEDRQDSNSVTFLSKGKTVIYHKNSIDLFDVPVYKDETDNNVLPLLMTMHANSVLAVLSNE